jgi:hypothetical protein
VLFEGKVNQMSDPDLTAGSPFDIPPTMLEAAIADLALAKGPDRHLDLRISVAINFKSVWGGDPDGRYEWKWGAGGDEIEGHRNGKRIAFLDPVQFVPRWTGDLSTARSLIPPGLFWHMAEGKVRPDEPLGAAQVIDPSGSGEVIAEAEAPTVEIAACIAALKARLDNIERP